MAAVVHARCNDLDHITDFHETSGDVADVLLLEVGDSISCIMNNTISILDALV